MDSKSFASKLAQKLGSTPAEAARQIEGFSSVLAELGANMDSAAIPGFGTFTTVKTDEHIVTDPTTGERTLVPPSVCLNFQASVVLRKKLHK